MRWEKVKEWDGKDVMEWNVKTTDLKRVKRELPPMTPSHDQELAGYNKCRLMGNGFVVSIEKAQQIVTLNTTLKISKKKQEEKGWWVWSYIAAHIDLVIADQVKHHNHSLTHSSLRLGIIVSVFPFSPTSITKVCDSLRGKRFEIGVVFDAMHLVIFISC
ncbi:uncharacterized protein G2W53_011797 [Senna tora]|uniref:Uncharacterized protein n=1 Tax=Senna tora TaxID=362788 RepID=A0A834TWW7_9FABA|nr:uncharacterized protein G2W53_011797 [Senna tora]